MKTFKKILRYLGLLILVGLVGFISYFYYMSSIKSDESILSKLNMGDSSYEIIHTGFEGVKYRYAVDLKNFDQEKPTLIFIHGAIGSSADFESYVSNQQLSSRSNMIVFDRPNYGPDYNEDYVHEIDFEARLVNDLASEYASNVKNILVGYSYGGPIALIAHAMDPYDSIVLLAPAVDPENEFVPVLVNFYKSPLTRWLVPAVWKEASKEKLDHVNQLNRYVQIYETLTGEIIHLHGTDDMLVPYENVDFLQERIPEDVYTHIAVEGAGHGFVWGSVGVITEVLLGILD